MREVGRNKNQWAGDVERRKSSWKSVHFYRRNEKEMFWTAAEKSGRKRAGMVYSYALFTYVMCFLCFKVVPLAL